MEKILKSCLSVLLLVIATQSLPGRAELIQNRNDLFFSQTEAVSSEELEKERGREGFDITTLNNTSIQAALYGNTANNNVTGANIINSGAFTNAGGMFSIVQNSGNNVIIQDSTTVNVTIIP